MKRWWLSVVAVALVGLIVVVVLLLAPKSALPATITKQAASTVLIPNPGLVQVQRDSARFDTKIKLLTFSTSIDGVRVVVSQQPTPESFVDIPQVFDKVTSSMNEYTKFESSDGTVHLTRPKDIGGKQAAVVNTKGTLLFAKPDSDLSDTQWRQYFKQLKTEG